MVDNVASVANTVFAWILVIVVIIAAGAIVWLVVRGRALRAQVSNREDLLRVVLEGSRDIDAAGPRWPACTGP